MTIRESDLIDVGAELLARAAAVEARVWKLAPALIDRYQPALERAKALGERLAAGEQPDDLLSAFQEVAAALDQAHRRH